MIELVVVIAVIAILLALGFPSLTLSIQNNRMAAQNNELVGLLAFSKSEAIRRNDSVPLLLTASSDGWDAVVEDPSHTEDVEGCVFGQLRCVSNGKVTITLSDAVAANGMTFNNRGYIFDDNDTTWVQETIFLQHDNCTGNSQRRRIDISPVGQVSSCSLPCDSTATCP